jgi:hypothetical protein
MAAAFLAGRQWRSMAAAFLARARAVLAPAPPQSRIELGRTAPFGVLAIDLLQQT